MLREACYDKVDPASFECVLREHKSFIDRLAVYDMKYREGDVAASYDMMMCDMMPFVREWGYAHMKGMRCVCAKLNKNLKSM